MAMYHGEHVEKLVFLCSPGDGAGRRPRKGMVPLVAGMSWDEFIGRVGKRLGLRGVQGIYAWDGGPEISTIESLFEVDEGQTLVVIAQDMTRRTGAAANRHGGAHVVVGIDSGDSLRPTEFPTPPPALRGPGRTGADPDEVRAHCCACTNALGSFPPLPDETKDKYSKPRHEDKAPRTRRKGRSEALCTPTTCFLVVVLCLLVGALWVVRSGGPSKEEVRSHVHRIAATSTALRQTVVTKVKESASKLKESAAAHAVKLPSNLPGRH